MIILSKDNYLMVFQPLSSTPATHENMMIVFYISQLFNLYSLNIDTSLNKREGETFILNLL
jgi:hypothetical protein